MSAAIRQVISIANSDLTIIEHQGERVVTLAMVDQVHQRPNGTARRNFNANRERFIEGKHLFKICASDFRTHKPDTISNKSHEDVILLTQRGYLLLVKSFTDELSWQVQDMLVDGYFEGQRPAAPPVTQRIAQSRHRLALAKELHRTRDAGLREVIHQQLDEVSRAMGLPTPELESLGRSAPKTPDVLKVFWEALAFLDSKGVAYNHATASNILALNLRELASQLLEHGQPLRFDSALRQTLWQSHSPRCLHKNRTVHSRLSGKSIKCWVFERYSES
ncbi:ORF6N domain-containing protein [Pseudomonas chlororaphis]|uniref:ORF6N domain-containing protein n=1 Tax=Pseudomonas chlororaphis TaxID=587753 RepID=UPI002407C9A3|nr:ORF6N domain-containing protein [Pseudomonas chlororaphis]